MDTACCVATLLFAGSFLERHWGAWPLVAPAGAMLDGPQFAGRGVQRFARRAFRRPVTASDVAPYVAIVKQRMDAGAAFQDAMLGAYRGILTSPDFMLLREPAGKLTAHALATRLSMLRHTVIFGI